MILTGKEYSWIEWKKPLGGPSCNKILQQIGLKSRANFYARSRREGRRGETNAIPAYHLNSFETALYSQFFTLIKKRNPRIRDLRKQFWVDLSIKAWKSFIFAVSWQPVKNETGHYGTELFAEVAERIIDTHNKSEPLYLYLAQQGVHSANGNEPLQAPERLVNVSKDTWLCILLITSLVPFFECLSVRPVIYVATHVCEILMSLYPNDCHSSGCLQSIFLSVCLRPSVCPSVRLFSCMCFCVSVCNLSVCPLSVCVSVRLFVCPYVCLFVCLSTCTSAPLYIINQLVYPSFYLSLWLSVCLILHLPLYLR